MMFFRILSVFAMSAAVVSAAENWFPDPDFQKGASFRAWGNFGSHSSAERNKMVQMVNDNGIKVMQIADDWQDLMPYALHPGDRFVTHAMTGKFVFRVKAPAGAKFKAGVQLIGKKPDGTLHFAGARHQVFTGNGEWKNYSMRLPDIPAGVRLDACFYPASEKPEATGKILVAHVELGPWEAPPPRAPKVFRMVEGETFDEYLADLQPGDTLVLAPGKYSGGLSPVTSGKPDLPITIRAEMPGSVTLTGGANPVISLKNLNHIRISGLSVRSKVRENWFYAEKCRNIEVTDCDFADAVQCWTPFSLNDVQFSRFARLKLDRCRGIPHAPEFKFTWGTDSDMFSCSNLFGNHKCAYNVYDDIRVSRAGHTPFDVWPECHHLVIRNCKFDSRWARGFEFFNVDHVLIENSVIANAYQGNGNADSSAKLHIRNSIFRRNLIFRNALNPLTAGSYQWKDWEPFSIKGSRMYFNTFFGNGGSGWMFAEAFPGKTVGNRFFNNIWSNNNPDGSPVAIRINDKLQQAENPFSGNIIFGRRPGDPVILMNNKTFFTLQEASQQFPAMFHGNVDADPLLNDPLHDDFSLRSGSPAIDRGEALAVTRSSGKGKVLEVSDAAVFYDGFGIPGEKGDLIVIGKKTARVVKRDLAAKTIELDRELAWKKGDAVNLPFAGKAPDCGAFEYGMKTGPQVPQNLMRDDDLAVTDRNPAIKCDFEPETVADWIWRLKTVRMGRSAMAWDTQEPAAKGRGSIRMIAAPDAGKDNRYRNLAFFACELCPVNWEIDRYPFVRLSYRIPKGTPVGLMAIPVEQKGRPERIYLAGTANCKRGNYPEAKPFIRLEDDGLWHEVRIDVRNVRSVVPEIRRLSKFGFRTEGNVRPGEHFWFDELTVERAEGNL